MMNENSIDMIMKKKCLTVLTAKCFCFVSLILVSVAVVAVVVDVV